MSDSVKKARNFTHVPFDRMTCPVAGCTYGPNDGPQEGTVPGIKRHARRLHPAEYGNLVFPDIRASVSDEAVAVLKSVTAPDDLSSLTTDVLKDMAKVKGVKGYSSMKKPDLVAALS